MVLTQYTVSIAGSDKHEHLLSTQAIIATQKQHNMTSDLREATFWAELRQELYVSTTTHRPPRLLIEAGSPSFAGTDEWDWSRWTIAHCCEVLDFAFGSSSNSMQRFQELMADNKRWVREKPVTFDPYYQVNEVKLLELFPDVRYQSSWHGMTPALILLPSLLTGLQSWACNIIYWRICFSSSTIPAFRALVQRGGMPCRRSTYVLRIVSSLTLTCAKREQASVRSHICRTSGIGYANSHTPAGMIVACLGIALCMLPKRDFLGAALTLTRWRSLYQSSRSGEASRLPITYRKDDWVADIHNSSSAQRVLGVGSLTEFHLQTSEQFCASLISPSPRDGRTLLCCLKVKQKVRLLNVRTSRIPIALLVHSSPTLCTLRQTLPKMYTVF